MYPSLPLDSAVTAHAVMTLLALALAGLNYFFVARA